MVEPRSKVMMTFVVLILLVAGLYMFSGWFSNTTGYAIGEDERVQLAQCLSGKDVVMYGSIYCKHCSDQKDVFGNTAFKFVDYIECSGGNPLCVELEGVPAWEINGTINYGVHSLEELGELSGCVLAEE